MEVVAAVREHVVRWFGAEPAVASVTFLGLEPIDILRLAGVDGLVHYVTLGCSRHPMGDPAAVLADPVRGPRAELVLTLRGGAGADVHRGLAVMAASPMVEGIVLQPDSLIDLGEPLWRGSAFTAALSGEPEIPELVSPEPVEPVRFLTVTPITATEAAWVRLRGAAALREAWKEADIDVHDPERGAAAL